MKNIRTQITRMIATVMIVFFIGPSWAQLVVDQYGITTIGNDTALVPLPTYLEVVGKGVSAKMPCTDSDVAIAIKGDATSLNPQYINIGIMGDASKASYTPYIRSIGVYGVAGYGENGYNYGVYASLEHPTGSDGTALFSTIYPNDFPTLNNYYAGYFHGNLYTNGTANITGSLSCHSFYCPSYSPNAYSRIIDNSEELLDRVVTLSSCTFTEEEENTSLEENPVSGTQSTTHYYLITENVKGVFPELIRNDEDGNSVLCYSDLVPVLVECIKELKTEIEDLKGQLGIETKQKTKKLSNIFDLNSTQTQESSYFKFSDGNTFITNIPNEIRDARVNVYNLSGKLLNSIEICSPSTSTPIMLPGHHIGQNFIYQLVLDGKIAETQKILISKNKL